MLGWDWVLIIGILSFFLWLVSVIYRNIFNKEEKVGFKYILVIVENQEKAIEGIIRKALYRFGITSQLIIIDMNSQDKTWQIISKMANPQNNFSVYRLLTYEKLNQLLNIYKNECLIFDYKYKALKMKNPRGL
jgi:hypothetical protein